MKARKTLIAQKLHKFKKREDDVHYKSLLKATNLKTSFIIQSSVEIKITAPILYV